MMILGGSPTMVAEPPMFAEHISATRNGTRGILRLLVTSIVSVAMNVPSAKRGRKDIVKIENRELEPDEINKIALIAPDATFNIIRDFSVDNKHKVVLPDTIEGIVRCENPNCISNKSEPILPKCVVISKTPVTLKCSYCDRMITDIIKNII